VPESIFPASSRTITCDAVTAGVLCNAVIDWANARDSRVAHDVAESIRITFDDVFMHVDDDDKHPVTFANVALWNIVINRARHINREALEVAS
jgi:hypothetical protein